MADACLRVGLPLRAAPPGLAPVVPGSRLAGRALPARHYGSVDAQEPDALASVRFGDHVVTRDDVVFADDDGVLFVAAGDVKDVLAASEEIHRKERDQASRIRSGVTLRTQTAFDDYRARRASETSYTFRQHLREVGGAIEE